MFGRQRAASPLTLLRHIAGMSQRRLAREIDVDIRIVQALESGAAAPTRELAEALKLALRDRGVSDLSLTLLDGIGAPLDGAAELSRGDLGTIERYLSDISGKLSSLLSGNPGNDVKAIVNRLETANGHLSTIASNTRR